MRSDASNLSPEAKGKPSPFTAHFKTHTPHMAGQATIIELEIDKLTNALAHLQRSIVELKEALAEAGQDLEYRDAINENLVTIAK